MYIYKIYPIFTLSHNPTLKMTNLVIETDIEIEGFMYSFVVCYDGVAFAVSDNLVSVLGYRSLNRINSSEPPEILRKRGVTMTTETGWQEITFGDVMITEGRVLTTLDKYPMNVIADAIRALIGNGKTQDAIMHILNAYVNGNTVEQTKAEYAKNIWNQGR